MTGHPAHLENLRRALSHFDQSRTGSEIAANGVKIAEAVRVFLYEPADGYQGDFTTTHSSGGES